jgi:hypothetical protein
VTPLTGRSVPRRVIAIFGEATVEYKFRITKLSGALHSERFHNCVTDDHALSVARMMLGPSQSEFRVEVWKGNDCIYDGIPSSWPFRRVRAAKPHGVPNPPRSAMFDDHDPPPAAA